MNCIEDNNALYLENSVRGILEGLILSIIRQKPECPIKFMINWLKNYLGESQMKNSEIEELMALRREMKKYIKKYPNLNIEEETKSDLEDNEDNDNGNCQNADGEIIKAKQRISVSAEAYGLYNKREEYLPKVIMKSDEQKETIKNKMKDNFLFNQLDEKELITVIDAFEKQVIDANEIIIKEGEKGDLVYLLDSGEAYCYKIQNRTNTFMKTYVAGESFGELALLYNAPRAATIIAKIPCTLWALERSCFNAIIKTAAIKRREEYEKVIFRVELFQTMNQYEISQICDALKVKRVKAGTKIITHNEEGNVFFILEEGEAYATKTIQGTIEVEKTVLQYSKGSYFGELALLKNEPRAANVYAKTDCQLLTLDRMAFKRLLGPLEAILIRNSEAYVKYTNQL